MDVEEWKNKIKVALEKDKNWDFWEGMRKLLKDIPIDRKEMLDILGRATLQNPAITSSLNINFDNVIKKLPYNEVLDMEKYVLETYCLYPGELILTSFWGKVKEWATTTKGRFFLTPYRLFAIGPIEMITTKFDFNPKNISAMKYRVMEKFRDVIAAKLHADLSTPRGIYGGILATFDAQDIKIKPKEISWKVNLDYKDDKDNPKTRTLTYDVDIEKGPNEDNNSFAAKLPAISAAFKQALGN